MATLQKFKNTFETNLKCKFITNQYNFNTLTINTLVALKVMLRKMENSSRDSVPLTINLEMKILLQSWRI